MAGPDLKYGRIFGNGTLIGDDNEAFLFKNSWQQATELGWSQGCPRKDEFINSPKYGLEWMLLRYAETNFWFKYIREQARVSNPDINTELSRATPRLESEPVGKHEPQSVPASHQDQISPMSDLYGYALPRILIEQIGQGQNRTEARLLTALDILDEVLPQSSNAAELLARLCEKVISNDADSLAVLHHIFPTGILEEENCLQTIRGFAKQLEQHSPALWSLYKNLTPEEKLQLGVIQSVQKHI